MEQQASSPVLSTDGRSCSNSHLGRSASNISSTPTVHPVFLNSSSSNFIFPSRLSLRKLKPEPWQRLFEGKKQQEISMKKNKSNVNTMLNEDFINLLGERSLFDESSPNPFLPAPIQTHIDHLYEQIDDSTLQLSEERFAHKQTRIKAKEMLLNQFKDQEKQFQELLQHKLLDHQNELKEQEKKYLKLLNEEQTQSLEREEQLRNELDFIKKSFHTYKVNLDKENVEKRQIKINEALAAMKEELPERKEEMNRRINDALMKERKHMNERRKIEIENIRKQHQKEIATFQKTSVDRESLESLKKELTLTKLELDEAKERAIHLSLQLKDLEIQHIKTTQELNNYRLRSDGKTKDIEKLYTERLD